MCNLILRRDVYRADTKLIPYWLKIPIYGVKGGINVSINTQDGKELGKVKGHHFHLRRSLVLNKAYKTIKKIERRERR